MSFDVDREDDKNDNDDEYESSGDDFDDGDDTTDTDHDDGLDDNLPTNNSQDNGNTEQVDKNKKDEPIINSNNNNDDDDNDEDEDYDDGNGNNEDDDDDNNDGDSLDNFDDNNNTTDIQPNLSQFYNIHFLGFNAFINKITTTIIFPKKPTTTTINIFNFYNLLLTIFSACVCVFVHPVFRVLVF